MGRAIKVSEGKVGLKSQIFLTLQVIPCLLNFVVKSFHESILI